MGSSHLIVLEENGKVSAYGDNGYGQCDTANWYNIKKVVAGDFHTAALSNNGKVVAVGDNTYGQCNVTDWKNIVELFANRNLTVGIDSKGKIWATSKESSIKFETPVNRATRKKEIAFVKQLLPFFCLIFLFGGMRITTL